MSKVEKMLVDLPELARTSQVARAFGVCNNTILRWAAAGRLPAPIRLSGTILRWDRDAILEAVRKQAGVAVA